MRSDHLNLLPRLGGCGPGGGGALAVWEVRWRVLVWVREWSIDVGLWFFKFGKESRGLGMSSCTRVR